VDLGNLRGGDVQRGAVENAVGGMLADLDFLEDLAVR
jgi:hypothetical protein